MVFNLQTLIIFTLFILPCAAKAEVINVKIDTAFGPVIVELYPDQAPVTVANFLNYVDAGIYNKNTKFYRVVREDNQSQNKIKIGVIQGGLNLSHITDKLPGIFHEATKITGLKHLDGTLSMARSEPGTATTEFFICIDDQPQLDYGGMRNPDGLGFAAFGKVIFGMHTVRRIQKGQTIKPASGSELEFTSGQHLQTTIPIIAIHRVYSNPSK